ncbi:acyltransferase family protein [Nocardioides exalbidus]|uniref:acyltransferase family protein n=1 Tax=Nocardioides exalbidus TaxID=402596 RepID=UPI0015879EFB|nr:acyltransferase [Nocardioides exalbidus]
MDGIRAIAATLVLLFHARIPGFANGGIGVDVFFTLSGFLITGILLSSVRRIGGVDYRVFYLRRALRLFPAYVAVVVAAVLADVVIDSGGTLKGALFSAFYVANWAVGGLGVGLGALGHTWSLSIEEQFYIGWPIVLVFLTRVARGRRDLLAILISMLVMASYLLAAILLAGGVSASLVYNATPTRAVELLAGALLAVLIEGRRQRYASLSRSAMGWVSILLLVLVGSWGSLSLETDILLVWPVVALLTCGTITAVHRTAGSLHRVLASKGFVEVGKRSYGLYLWHFPIFTTIDAEAGLDTWPPRLLAMALTAVIVPLSYRYIEQPFLALKDRTGTGRASQLGEGTTVPEMSARTAT